MKSTSLTCLLVSVVLTFFGGDRADAAPFFHQIDFGQLGATTADVGSPGGQTFVDIGSILGIPSLQGIDLNIRSEVAGGNVVFPAASDSSFWQSLLLIGDSATAHFSFSVPVHVQLTTGGILTDGEAHSFGAADAGGIVFPTESTEVRVGTVDPPVFEPISSLTGFSLTDDSLANNTGDRIIVPGEVLWQGSGESFSIKLLAVLGLTGFELPLPCPNLLHSPSSALVHVSRVSGPLGVAASLCQLVPTSEVR